MLAHRCPGTVVVRGRSTGRCRLQGRASVLVVASAAASPSPSAVFAHQRSLPQGSARAGPSGVPHDVILSSGFLAFAHHSGFLQSVEEAGLQVGGVMGTSAGALAGALYCAGYSPRQVAAELSRVPPIHLLRPSMQPWRGGLLSLAGVVDRLRQLLPPRFEDLQREFAVGVVGADGQHQLIDKGPLAEAVAASAAVPFMFEGVSIPGHGRPLRDGGMVDRVGVSAWRDRRRMQAGPRALLPTCLVHVISRSSPFSGADDTEASGEPGLVLVNSPRSGLNLFSLGDFEGQFAATRHRSRPHLERFKVQQQQLQEQLVAPSRSPDRLRGAAAGGAALPGVVSPLSPDRLQSPERMRGSVPLPRAAAPSPERLCVTARL